jgi:biopolymer transport protein ExbB/TolQ
MDHLAMYIPTTLLAEGSSFWSLVSSSVRASSAIENAILLLLLVCSIVSWGIVLWKVKSIRSAKAANARLADAFVSASTTKALGDEAKTFGTSPNVQVLTAALKSIDDATARKPVSNGSSSSSSSSSHGSTGQLPRGGEARVQMAMDHASRGSFAKLHRGMDILASIASATPFIGLFGTVLGIMHTFQVLGTAKSASLNVVAPGIAAALSATAAGLAVAIPAVFLYNWLNARIDELQEDADMFGESLGQWFASTGVFQVVPTAPHAHAASEPMIVGTGAHVSGARE